MDRNPVGGGIFDSLRRALDSAVALVKGRLELFLLELQEEKFRCFDLLIRAALVAVLAFVGLLAAIATLVVALWNLSPVLVLGTLTLLCLLGAWLLWRGIRKELREGPKPFAATLEEFKKDGSCLRKKD